MEKRLMEDCLRRTRPILYGVTEKKKNFVIHQALSSMSSDIAYIFVKTNTIVLLAQKLN